MSVSKDAKTKTWIVQLWYKDFSGKRKHTTKRGFATKREAEKYEREFLCTDQHPEKITIGALAKKYRSQLDIKLETGEIRDTTLYKEKSYIDLYILPYFEDTVADKVTTDNINEWMRELIKNYKSKKGVIQLGAGTVRNARAMLSRMYEYGIRNLGLSNNPTLHSNRISSRSNDTRVIWTKEEFLKFRNAMAQYPAVRLVYDIIYGSGLRIGEVLALTPGDISRYKISVAKTLVWSEEKGYEIHDPKTPSSERDVEITRSLFFLIDDYIQDLPPDTKPTDRMFPFSSSYCRYYMHKVEKSLGLPHSSPHFLRHMYASLIYGETKDLTIVAEQLGHANIRVTSEVYVDMIKGKSRKTVDDLEGILALK